MARVVKVRLLAVVDDYKKGMLEAAQATRTVGTEAEKLAQTRQAMQTVGTFAVGMGAAVAAGIGVAVAKFAEFDQAMSFVAATGDDARGSIESFNRAGEWVKVLQPYVVLDRAKTWFNELPVKANDMSSAAVGLRFGDNKYYNIALEAAKPMSDIALDSYNRRPRYTLSFSYQL